MLSCHAVICRFRQTANGLKKTKRQKEKNGDWK